MPDPSLWTRYHLNDWTAIVSLEQDGSYNASAHAGGFFDNPHWTHQHIDRLEAAQEIADGDVQEHDCSRCPPWAAGIQAR